MNIFNTFFFAMLTLSVLFSITSSPLSLTTSLLAASDNANGHAKDNDQNGKSDSGDDDGSDDDGSDDSSDGGSDDSSDGGSDDSSDGGSDDSSDGGSDDSSDGGSDDGGSDDSSHDSNDDGSDSGKSGDGDNHDDKTVDADTGTHTAKLDNSDKLGFVSSAGNLTAISDNLTNGSNLTAISDNLTNGSNLTAISDNLTNADKYGRAFYIQIKSVNNKTDFVPDKATLTQGDKVVWLNYDNSEHRITVSSDSESGYQLLNSLILPNGMVDQQFQSPGTYYYSDLDNPHSKGTITILDKANENEAVSVPSED